MEPPLPDQTPTIPNPPQAPTPPQPDPNQPNSNAPTPPQTGPSVPTPDILLETQPESPTDPPLPPTTSTPPPDQLPPPPDSTPPTPLPEDPSTTPKPEPTETKEKTSSASSSEKSTKKAILWIIIAAIIFLIIMALTYFIGTSGVFSAQKPTNYQECTLAKGSTIQESYPATCVTTDGQHFTQPLSKKDLNNLNAQNSTDSYLYENQERGYGFEYPGNWFIGQTFEDIVDGHLIQEIAISNYDLESAPNEDSLIRINVVAKQTNQSALEYLKEHTNWDTKSLQEEVTVDNLTGIKIKYTGSNNMISVAFKHQNYIISINSNDKAADEAMLDQILSSFKFLASSEKATAPTIDTSDWNTYSHEACGTQEAAIPFSLKAPSDWTEETEEGETFTTYRLSGNEGSMDVTCGTNFGTGNCPEPKQLSLADTTLSGCLKLDEEVNRLILDQAYLDPQATSSATFSFEASIKNEADNESLLKQILKTFTLTQSNKPG